MEFTPRLDILPAPQRLLWDELRHTPDQFTLYGGTAIALHLGHRNSVDFDFFSLSQIDPHHLKRTVPYLASAHVQRLDENTLTCLVDRDGPVKMSFFGLPNIGRIRPALTAAGVRVAHLLDLAGTKAQVVQARAEAKDYIDIDALIERGRVTLPYHLTAAALIYGRHFAPLPTLKALSYFDDVPGLPADVQRRLQRAVAATDPEALPALTVEEATP